MKHVVIFSCDGYSDCITTTANSLHYLKFPCSFNFFITFKRSRYNSAFLKYFIDIQLSDNSSFIKTIKCMIINDDITGFFSSRAHQIFKLIRSRIIPVQGTFEWNDF